jgi:PAS domain S-box-containing protein
MTQDNRRKKDSKEPNTTHEFYMTILNCAPNVIYWVDLNTNLQGCNKAFVQLLSLNKIKDFNGTPYQQMRKFAHWSEKTVEKLKLDDMEVIFSGVAHYNRDEPVITDKDGKSLYFQATRVPIYDDNKNITGLIVVLADVGANKKPEERVTATEVEPQAAAELINGHIPTVLMIEDNLIAQNVEKAILTELNCQVDIAGTGDNALALFGPGKYDLVLMDIGLGDTSGYAVAKKLRKMEENTQYHVPIIALTGYEADVVKADCEKYFMEGVITKPLTPKQAEQIIKHYVHNLDVPVSGLKHN